jgi:aryl-alcohol dehydrogenase-like predicted oxidoreductase
MCSRFARLFWVPIDRVDHAAGVTRCWVVDLIYGPEPPTLVDEKREADHERLRRAFPNIDIDGSIAIAEEGQQLQATPMAQAKRAGVFIAPIPGAKSRKHIEENVRAAEIVLTAEDLAESTASSRPVPRPVLATR